MVVILPVAGKGTRLRPHTHSKPKSLVRVAGRTVLEYVVLGLRNIKVDLVVFVCDENGHLIEKYVTEHFPRLPARYVEQADRLGPAHAVWLAAPYIREGDDVLIVFNDTLFVTDLGRIPELVAGKDGLIYSKEVEDYRRFGVNVVRDGVIVDMVEKPEQPISRLAQVGLYYLRDGKRLMDAIGESVRQNLKVKGEFYLPPVFKLMMDQGARFGAPEIDEWLDCGKPETLLATNRYLLEHGNATESSLPGAVIIPPVAIHPSAQVVNSVIGPHVSIAERCRIDSCVIRDSVVNADSQLHNVILEGSIIGDSVELSGVAQQISIGDNSVIHLGR